MPKTKQLAAAIADFEAEYGEITEEEIASQLRADRAYGTVVPSARLALHQRADGPSRRTTRPN